MTNHDIKYRMNVRPCKKFCGISDSATLMSSTLSSPPLVREVRCMRCRSHGCATETSSSVIQSSNTITNTMSTPNPCEDARDIVLLTTALRRIATLRAVLAASTTPVKFPLQAAFTDPVVALFIASAAMPAFLANTRDPCAAMSIGGDSKKLSQSSFSSSVSTDRKLLVLWSQPSNTWLVPVNLTQLMEVIGKIAAKSPRLAARAVSILPLRAWASRSRSLRLGCALLLLLLLLGRLRTFTAVAAVDLLDAPCGFAST
mmetsp:Transcript_30025/g.69947  ORF Transcript_30025/g.69947 Transcript_30025/m.69947 type:complete len:258 (-) Transcript_30025:422-1195(-)